MFPPMQIRAYQPSTDLPALGALYRQTVLAIGPQHYSPQQVSVWASYGDDLDAIAPRLSQGITLVGTVDDQPIAFGQLAPADYLAFLYCHSDHCRRGYASAIYDVLESHARQAGSAQITTHASVFSRPVFARKGFEVVEIEQANVKDVHFERYIMRKTLIPARAE